MGDTPTLCYWKELWRLTSAFSSSESSEMVKIEIDRVQDQLTKGLCYYKPSSLESLTVLKTKCSKYTRALSFIEKLQQFMGLDSLQTWDIFCHYLSNRYHGTVENALNNFSFLDVQTSDLLIDVWTFYNSERIFMLKQLRLILELKTDTNYAYQKEFDCIIKKITINQLKKSLIQQFKYLIEENPPSKSQNGEMITFEMQKKSMKRNLSEQAEVLQMILLVIDESVLSIQEFKQLFALFKLHNFGRQPVYYKYLDDSHIPAVMKIVYAEVAIFYKMIYDSKGEPVSTIINNVKDDVEGELIRLQHNEEHGAFLLAWMLLLLEDPNNEEMFFTRYQHFGTKALQLRVFEFLYNMNKHSMFSNDNRCGKIFRSSIYHLLSNMCNRFDGDGSMAQHVCAIELCSELLSSPLIANDFWKLMEQATPVGVVSLWNTALEYFPYDFRTLSIMIIGLASASTYSYEKLMKELNNLPMYCIRYKPRMVSFSNLNDEENVIITSDFHPYQDKEFVVKASTHAAIMDRRNTTLIHFHTTVSYWNVFYDEVHNLIDYSLRHNSDISNDIENLVWAIKALNVVLQRNDGTPLPELIRPCEAVFELLTRFLHAKLPYVSLISSSLDVLTTLVPIFTDEIFTRLMNVKLLPFVENSYLSDEQYVKGETFNTSLIGHFLVNIEQLNGEYHIFTSYLNLVSAFYDSDYNDSIAMGVLLPGLIFILREIFPHMFGWVFKSFEEKQKLHFKCVSYLFKILNLSPENTMKVVDQLLNKICLHSLLNLENGTSLLKLISYGEQNIQSLMNEETNWSSGVGVKQIKMIQISMSTLMQVLRLKHLIRDKTILSPIEHLIYTQPKQKDTMRIIPIVTDYMNHVFNKNLPNTACRLLKRFASESHLSLLVCLDMTPHQIRTMFLERLRDKCESDILKTVILEFVATCVENQPGLTEVFFKVSHSENNLMFVKETSNENTDGILTYMAEYLSAVNNDTSNLYSPLLNRIMSLFHALWKNNMQMLVRDLRKNPNFWEYLCSPLFQEILPDIKAYSQIFNMMGIELFLFEGKVDKSLQTALEKLFDNNGMHLTAWVEYIYSFNGRETVQESVDEIPGWLSLVTSWKDFSAIVMKHLPFPMNIENKYTIASLCLNVLIKELGKMSDNRVITMLAEMYVIYISNWKEDCFDDRQEFMQQIAILLNNVSSSFEVLHHRAIYSILSICTLSINILAYDLMVEKEVSANIFQSVCFLNDLQLDKMLDYDKVDEERSNCIIMGLRLLEQVIYVFKHGFLSLDSLFTPTNLINKLVISTTEILHKFNRFRQTLAALDCLTAFARNNMSKVFLYCNISENLWLKFLPPKELFSPTQDHNTNNWDVNSWWQVYRSGIEFVTVVLQNQGNYFSPSAILFAGVQEEYLTESILMPRQTLDIEALNLTHSALYFVSELIKHQAKWKYEHSQSLINLMRSISMCLHYCITLVLRPRGIHHSIESPSKLLTMEETDNSGPTPKVAGILNKLLELMHLSAICLKSFSPDLLNLLTDPYIELTSWQPLMELQFGAPKISSDPNPTLTFGTVLSAVCLLTRSLSCNYHAEDAPLNVIKKHTGRKSSLRRRISGGSSIDDSVRRRSFRSDSVTSMSSTTSIVITPNWLVVLDKKMVQLTLETILTLLASQSLLAVKDMKMANRDKQLIRRELCAELPIFHDFVKKKIIDSLHPKNYLSRRKYGIYPLLKDEEECKMMSLKIQSADESNVEMEEEMESEENLFTPPPPPRKRVSDSMRVSVVRKLHLDKKKTVGDTSRETPEHSRLSLSQHSTPKSGESSLDGSQKSGRSTKHVTWDEYSLSPQEQVLHETTEEDFEYNLLSEVQMVEEDYLHFLSNVFLYICQTDN